MNQYVQQPVNSAEEDCYQDHQDHCAENESDHPGEDQSNEHEESPQDLQDDPEYEAWIQHRSEGKRSISLSYTSSSWDANDDAKKSPNRVIRQSNPSIENDGDASDAVYRHRWQRLRGGRSGAGARRDDEILQMSGTMQHTSSLQPKSLRTGK